MTETEAMLTKHESIIDHDIIVFSKADCVQCVHTKRTLTRRGLEFHEIALDDPNVRLTDQGYATPYEFCTETLGAKAAPVIMVRSRIANDDDPNAVIFSDFVVWNGFRYDKLQNIK